LAGPSGPPRSIFLSTIHQQHQRWCRFLVWPGI